MLNLIMVARDDNWNVHVGEVGSSTFPISRYLEYTDDQIAYKFNRLDISTFSKLKSLPCVFMTEVHNNLSHIRIGKITDISVNNKDIVYSFEFTDDFQLINIDQDNSSQNNFFSGRWELYRTHWAIKNINLKDFLEILDLSSNSIPNIEKIIPEKPGTTIATVTSVEGFLRQLKKNIPETGFEIFYRGHGDIKYKLEPSVLRKNKNNDPYYLKHETNIINELLTAHPSEFYTDQFMLDKLVRMQHFGLPTRLLDVTANPLVALYFCCSDIKYDNTSKEIDGDIKIFHVNSKDIKFYNSDTVSCIANLSMLDITMKNILTSPEKSSDLKQEARKKLLHFIQAEKPYFTDDININDLQKIQVVRGRNANPRISSQSGAFLLFGHDVILPDTGHSNLNVTNIIVKNKKNILLELEQLNIKSSTIFPGIEQTAREIAKKYKIE